MRHDLITCTASYLLIFFFLGNDLFASVAAVADLPAPRQLEKPARAFGIPIITGSSENETAAPKTVFENFMGTSGANPKNPASAKTYSRIEFLAATANGFLGNHPKDPMNLPSDDFFTVEVKEGAENLQNAYLQYSIKGLADGLSIPKSVNGNATFSGLPMRLAAEWQTVKFPIEKSALKDGENQVRFSLPRNWSAAVEIKDVSLIFTDEKLAENPMEAVARELADPADFEILAAEGEDESAAEAFALADVDMPSVPRNIKNLTRGKWGYMAVSQNESVNISIGIDRARGLSQLHQARIFYFDEESLSWKAAAAGAVNAEEMKVAGEVPSNTNYFAGMIETPEMPEAAAYVPTAVSDIQAANPAEGMSLMQPPSISNTGEANIHYPLDIPAGRQGMQPNLALSYSSDKGTGWLGVGWDISAPMVSVDAKWGVPTFSTSHETEVYSLNGKSLTMEGGHKANRDKVTAPRPNKNSVRFFERTMTGYKEIERYGGSPSDYVWTETMADGTKYYYGSVDGQTVQEHSVLRQSGSNSPIVKWYLRKVEDKWGNNYKYSYLQEDALADTNGIKDGGSARVLNQIIYTGWEDPNGQDPNEQGKYFIKFNSSRHRKDATVSLRLGVKELDERRLDSVEVFYDGYGGTKVKTWRFGYTEGDFFKTLLQSVAEYRNGEFFYEHEFEYHEGDLSFSSPQTVSIENRASRLFDEMPDAISEIANALGVNFSPSNLKTTTTWGWQAGGTIGLGLQPGPNPWQVKSFTFSGQLGYGENYSRDRFSLNDFNGDGLPDLVYDKSRGQKFSPLRIDASGSLSFGERHNMGFNNRLFKSKSGSLTYGFDFSLFIKDIGYFYGQNWNRTKSKVKNYLTDYNADGFNDVVVLENGISRIQFGRPGLFGEIEFDENSEKTANPVFKGANATPAGFDAGAKDFEIVRTWQAPFDGTIKISGTAEFYNALNGKVFVGVQKNNAFLGNGMSQVDTDNSVQTHHICSVSKGDKILFRTNAGTDGQQDLLHWNPSIAYLGANSERRDGNGINYGVSSYAEGFLLSSGSGISLRGDQKIKIDWPAFMVNNLSDDLLLRVNLNIVNRNSLLRFPVYYDYTVPANSNQSPQPTQFRRAGQTFAPPFMSSFDNLYSLDSNWYCTFQFEIYSTSNVDWTTIDWRPKVFFETSACGQPEKAVYPTVKFNTYNRLSRMVDPFEFDPNSTRNSELATWPVVEYHQGTVGQVFPLQEIIDGEKDVYLAYLTTKSQGRLLSVSALMFDDSGNFERREVYGYADTGTANILSPAHPALRFNKGLVDENLHFEIFTPHEKLGKYLTEVVTAINLYGINEGGGLVLEGQTELYNVFFTEINELQDHHLHWGQFCWDPDETGATVSPIDTSELHLPTEEMAKNEENDFSDVEEPDESELTSHMENNIDEEEMNPMNQKFSPLRAVRGENRFGLRKYVEEHNPSKPTESLDRWSAWGSFMGCYQDGGTVAPGLLGEEEEEETDPPAPPTDFDAYGIVQESKSLTKAITAGMSTKKGDNNYSASASQDKPKFYSESLSSFRDVNGDGYPDILKSGSTLEAKLTDGKGGHRSSSTFDSGDGTINKSKTLNAGLTLQGYYANNDPRFQKTSASGGLNFGTNSTLVDWIDINGDGLPDRATDNSNSLSVELNNGTTLIDAATVTLDDLGFSYNLSTSLGGGLGTAQKSLENLKIEGGYSFGAGIGMNTTATENNKIVLDLNGDGLPDMVKVSLLGEATVYLNKGTGFEEYTSADLSGITAKVFSESFGIFGSGTASGAVSLASFGLANLKLSGSINGQFNYAVNKLKSNFMDMNGDGNVDFVETNSGEMSVFLSEVGKSNLLKKVTNPLKGSFALDYKRMGNKYGFHPTQIKLHHNPHSDQMLWDMPESKWVMNELTVHDGLDITSGSTNLDGADETQYRFAYDGGIKSRREREFLGFTRTQTHQPANNHIPTEGALVEWLSSVTEYARPETNDPTYRRRSEYLRGIPQKMFTLYHSVQDTGDETTAYVDSTKLVEEQRYGYEYRNISIGDDQDTLFNRVNKLANGDWQKMGWDTVAETQCIFPALISTETISIPQVAEPEKFYAVKYDSQFDKYMNVTEYSNAASAGAGQIDTVITDTIIHHYIDFAHKYFQYGDFDTSSLSPEIDTILWYWGYGEHRPILWPPPLLTQGTSCTEGEQTPYDCDNIPSYVNYYTSCSEVGSYCDSVNYLLNNVAAIGKIYPDFVIKGPDSTYSSDTLGFPNYHLKYAAGGDPCNFDTISIMVENDTIMTTHRKEVIDTILIKEVQYNVPYHGNIIARMDYFPPSRADQRTNALRQHRVYLGTVNAAGLRRHSKVDSLWQGKAPYETWKYLDNTDYAQTNLTYSNKGNVLQAQGPPNHQGQRMTTDFRYEGDKEQHIISVANSYGDSVCSLYDLPTGNLLKSSDINGHATQYVYDGKYRLKEFWGPRELQDAGAAATLTFEYRPYGIDSLAGDPYKKVPVAFTRHNFADAEDRSRDNLKNENGIVNVPAAPPASEDCSTVADLSSRPAIADPTLTATFADGLGRAVQVKKQSIALNSTGTGIVVRVHVSGHTAYDRRGMDSAISQDFLAPSSQFLGRLANTATPNVADATYDYANRPAQQRNITESGAFTTTEYTYQWDERIDGQPYFNTLTEVAGMVSQSYTNSQGQGIATVQWHNTAFQQGSSTTVSTVYQPYATTRFQYDALNQLLQTTDPLGVATTYQYDFFGRATQEDHDDRGLSSFTFDKAGNLTQVDNPASGSAGIRMRYHYNRLTEKTMPDYGSVGNVAYAYGTRGDGKNGAGRVTQTIQGDQFKEENYWYDELGNRVKEQKRIKLPKTGQQTFYTQFIYDSWGRTIYMRYPDAEGVDYSYYDTGELLGIMGQKNGQYRNILNHVHYDGFGNILQKGYGNAVWNNFTYHNGTTRRLKNVSVKTLVPNDWLMGKRLYYDARGNVRRAANDTAQGGIGGTYDTEYFYDELNRLDSTYAVFGGGQHQYSIGMDYNEAGGIEKKVQNDALNPATGEFNYDLEYDYSAAKKHQINWLQDAAQAKQWYEYNISGSVADIYETAGSDTTHHGQYLWDEEQKLSGVKNLDGIHHYVYDQNGERMLKGSVTYNTISNNSVTHADDYYLDPYTVYVNPYYVATHHSTTVEASKHYYMNSQRIASALIDQFFVCEEDEICGLEVNNDPTHDHGFEGSSLRGVAQNLSDLLAHFGLADGTDYEMDTLEKLEHFSQYFTQNDYNSATDGCDVLDAECHCAHSTYWAEREEFDCSEYPLVYWYHPDYLGNTEYVTDMNGEAFQYFWYSPWGESWVEEHSSKGSYESPYRFNAKELDQETGLYYYGARYYAPKGPGWLSVDPLAHKFPWQTPYAFTDNNPVNLVDPTGMSAEPPDGFQGGMWQDETGTYYNVGGLTGDNSDFVRTDGEGNADGFYNSGSDMLGEATVTGNKMPAMMTGRENFLTRGTKFERFSATMQANSKLFHNTSNAMITTATAGLGVIEHGNTLGLANDLAMTSARARLLGYRVSALSIGIDLAMWQSGNLQSGELMLNSTFTLYGLYGGPIGIAGSLSYGIMRVLGAEEQGVIMQQNMLQKMNDGNFKMRGTIGGGSSGRNLTKPKNPKF